MEISNFRENNHLRPIVLNSKDEYLSDIYNIDRSFTGRLDAWIANTFILESSYLVINSIALFEKGYFDCAFYSLRQSLEIATTMMYLVDSDEETRIKERRKWKGDKNFPD